MKLISCRLHIFWFIGNYENINGYLADISLPLAPRINVQKSTFIFEYPKSTPFRRLWILWIFSEFFFELFSDNFENAWNECNTAYQNLLSQNLNAGKLGSLETGRGPARSRSQLLLLRESIREPAEGAPFKSSQDFLGISSFMFSNLITSCSFLLFSLCCLPVK